MEASSGRCSPRLQDLRVRLSRQQLLGAGQCGRRVEGRAEAWLWVRGPEERRQEPTGWASVVGKPWVPHEAVVWLFLLQPDLGRNIYCALCSGFTRGCPFGLMSCKIAFFSFCSDLICTLSLEVFKKILNKYAPDHNSHLLPLQTKPVLFTWLSHNKSL